MNAIIARMDDLIDLATAHWIVAVSAVAAGLFAALLTHAVLRRREVEAPAATQPSAIERRFRNVFAIMGESRRESLIEFYAQKHACGREDAMQHALDDRDKDARRW